MKYGFFPFNYSEISAILSGCGREKRLLFGSSIHGYILKSISNGDSVVVWNSLISMYSKCGQLSHARKLFDEMPLRDTVTWNSMISAFLAANQLEKGFWYFKALLSCGSCGLDHASMTTMLSVCAGPEFLRTSTVLHSLTVFHGFEQMVSVRNALITAYFNCENQGSARKMFDEMFERNVITWTAMVSGLARCHMCRESLVLFREMQQSCFANSLTYSSSLFACSGMRAVREGQQIHGLVLKSGIVADLCVDSALMDMYSKCGFMEDAYRVFQACEEPDDVFLTVILVGFAQNGLEERAFELFVKMVGEGVKVDANMVSAVLGAFGAFAPFALGKQIHALVVKTCLEFNVFVSNGLINMYSKCGDLCESLKVFELMTHRNSVTWNSLIAAFARHGHGAEALELYESMRSESIEPTDVTFLSLLHACSHVGAIEKGMEFINSMSMVYKIEPRMEHYACVVDMLGRAGLVHEAKSYIEKLPVKPNAVLWQALLGACSIHSNAEVGEYAADRLLLLEPGSAAAYVLLANIYSSQRQWKKRAEIILKMKEMKVKKDVGVSWIEVEKNVHCFVVEDKVHLQADYIYEVLDALAAVIKYQEHVPDKLTFNNLIV
ncbi:putative tetratricopeptide-like helical domain superfamily [Dioscorea sansibarensis]